MYGFSIQLKVPFDTAVAKVTEALKNRRFRCAHRHRCQGDAEGQAQHRATALSHSLAHRAIEADPDIGLLLPCNVVVREEANGDVTVAFMDPEAVLRLVDKPEVHAVGKRVRTQLQRVCHSLKA